MFEWKKHFNKKYTTIAIYTVITFLIIFLLVRFTDNITAVFFGIRNGIHFLGIVLKPVIAGFVIAYILHPVVGFFEKQFCKFPIYKGDKAGKARTPAVALTMILAAAFVTAILSIVVSTFARQIILADFDTLSETVKLYVRNLNSLYRNMNIRLNELNLASPTLESYIEEAGGVLASAIQGVAKNMIASATNVGSFLTNTIFAIIFCIYFLIDGEPLKNYWGRVLKVVVKPRGYQLFCIFVKEADRVFSGYIRGQLLDAVIVALMASVTLTLFGVRYAVLIGILSGIGNLIPYVGPMVGYGSTILVCMLNGDIDKMIIGIIVFFVIQTIDGNIINPKLLSSNISVHPMLVIIALIAGSAIGGFMGMLLAVPVAALAKELFDGMINSLDRKNQARESERAGGETV
ncbi:Predicted PurR-regulated permease PerM [Lachnospiraceae bacterium]|nr:Predicted PurR-regulated permease PerM [Lachnospiraceae bacterium]